MLPFSSRNVSGRIFSSTQLLGSSSFSLKRKGTGRQLKLQLRNTGGINDKSAFQQVPAAELRFNGPGLEAGQEFVPLHGHPAAPYSGAVPLQGVRSGRHPHSCRQWPTGAAWTGKSRFSGRTSRTDRTPSPPQPPERPHQERPTAATSSKVLRSGPFFLRILLVLGMVSDYSKSAHGQACEFPRKKPPNPCGVQIKRSFSPYMAACVQKPHARSPPPTGDHGRSCACRKPW